MQHCVVCIMCFMCCCCIIGRTNGAHADVPPIEIDGEAEYEVSSIKGLRDEIERFNT